MAQHYDINTMDGAWAIKAARVIRADFARAYGMRTSFKYRFCYEGGGQEVYQCERKIPAGIMVGTVGLFEVHTKINKPREVEIIYFVA